MMVHAEVQDFIQKGKVTAITVFGKNHQLRGEQIPNPQILHIQTVRQTQDLSLHIGVGEKMRRTHIQDPVGVLSIGPQLRGVRVNGSLPLQIRDGEPGILRQDIQQPFLPFCLPLFAGALCAVFGGSQAILLPETAVKQRRGGESAVRGGLRHGNPGILQKASCVVQPDTAQVGGKALPGGLLKDAGNP